MIQNKKDLRINEQEASEIRFFNTDTIYTANFSTTVKKLIRAEMEGENFRIPIPDDVREAAANRVDCPSNFTISLSKDDSDIAEFIEGLSRGGLKRLIIRLLKQAFEEPAKKLSKKDYDACKVDDNIPHTLDEDFEHTTPAAFSINGNRNILRYWKDFFPTVLEQLIDDNNITFDSLALEALIEEGMKGKGETYYLCRNSTSNKMKKLRNADGYVTTAFGARQATEFTGKLFDAVGLPKDCIKIFIKADRRRLYEKGGGLHG